MGYRRFHRVGESEVVEMAFGRVNVRFVMAVREGAVRAKGVRRSEAQR